VQVNGVSAVLRFFPRAWSNRDRTSSPDIATEALMKRSNVIMAIMCAAGTVPAVMGQLPGTLNFKNVTSARIHQTVGEVASNEKEVEFGDFDNDTDLDVVIANAHGDFGQRKNKLYRNDDGEFFGISGSPAIPGFSGTDVARNAFFRDFDNDGWLDIIIVNDRNTSGDPGRTKIYINQHPVNPADQWFIEEGVSRLGSGTGGAACGAVSFDPDMDLDFDLYVGNYPGPSQDTMYFNNNATGFFTAMTTTHVPVDGDYTVDVATADMNGDGKVDLLVSNGFSDPNYIYYNNNLDAGSANGDFNYTNSTQQLGFASSENAMEAGDFDNDNDMDLYWTNATGGADRVMVNTGNVAGNKAGFLSLASLPPSVMVTSRKATVADLNDDGRVDVFVMKAAGASSRPTVLRNTSIDGAISFVDWTPALAFPNGSTHQGWHAAVFDADNDEDQDIFIGGWANDHLIANEPGTEWNESTLTGGLIPVVFNKVPAAVVGSVGEGTSDTYELDLLAGSNGFLSVVLDGADDYQLEILDSDGGVLATIDRGGLGVEEATQYNWVAAPSILRIRVTGLDCANQYNVSGNCGVDVGDFFDLIAAWGPNPGHPADNDGNDVVDTIDFFNLLANWGDSDYILHVLSRN
jgi:hypothetical protein